MSVAEAPSLPAATWLYSTLAGDATLAALAPGGVFGRGYTPQAIRRLAPAWPAVVYRQLQGGGERYTLDGAFTLAVLKYEIQVIDKSGDQGLAQTAAARVHTLIAHPERSDASGHVQRCVRRQVIDRAEVADGGAQFQHVGGTYDLWVRG